MNTNFFKGNFLIMCNIKDIKYILMNTNPQSMLWVINLDEEYTDPILNSPLVVPGTVLLPPIEAMWAEVDMDFEKFEALYHAHLMNQECKEFIYVLLGFLYRGGTLILHYPDPDTYSIKYLYKFFEIEYGIHISTNVEDPFRYNPTYIPMFDNNLYFFGIISAYEYLYEMPLEVQIPDDLYLKIDYDLHVPKETMNGKRNLIDIIKVKIKSNPKTKFAIMQY